MKHLCSLTAVTCALLILSACGAQPIPTTTTTQPEVKNDDDLMTEWYGLSTTDYNHIDFDRALIIANELALQGPNGLDPLFKVLEDSATTQMAKMLAAASLSPHINDSHAKRLIPLTEVEQDSATRGCAVHLLGKCLDADSFFKVQELTHDNDEHVRNVASMVMLRKGNVEVLPTILKIWESPDAPAMYREEIVLGMPPMIAIKHLNIFADVICDEAISNTTRSYAAKVLADLAAADVLPAIKDCLGKTEASALREALEAALAAIEKREAEGTSVALVPMPSGMDLVFQPKPAETPEAPAENVPNAEQNN
jgi:hypothetical protein